MRKIVYNPRYGGFGISKKALEFLIKNEHKESNALNAMMNLYQGVDAQFNYDSYNIDDCISRSDPLLVKAVEVLGPESYGTGSKLMIEEVPDNVHVKIEEYDGFETIHQIHCDCCLAGK